MALTLDFKFSLTLSFSLVLYFGLIMTEGWEVCGDLDELVLELCIQTWSFYIANKIIILLTNLIKKTLLGDMYRSISLMLFDRCHCQQ